MVMAGRHVAFQSKFSKQQLPFGPNGEQCEARVCRQSLEVEGSISSCCVERDFIGAQILPFPDALAWIESKSHHLLSAAWSGDKHFAFRCHQELPSPDDRRLMLQCKSTSAVPKKESSITRQRKS